MDIQEFQKKRDQARHFSPEDAFEFGYNLGWEQKQQEIKELLFGKEESRNLSRYERHPCPTCPTN